MISPLICVHTTMTDCFPLKNQMRLCLAGVPATCNPNSDYRQSLQLHWWIVSRPPRSMSWRFIMNSTEITSHPFTPLLFVLAICVHYFRICAHYLCSCSVYSCSSAHPCYHDTHKLQTKHRADRFKHATVGSAELGYQTQQAYYSP